MTERNTMIMTQTHSDISVTAPVVQGLPLFARSTSLNALLNLRLLP